MVSSLVHVSQMCMYTIFKLSLSRFGVAAEEEGDDDGAGGESSRTFSGMLSTNFSMPTSSGSSPSLSPVLSLTL